LENFNISENIISVEAAKGVCMIHLIEFSFCCFGSVNKKECETLGVLEVVREEEEEGE
jgi:hypothetical protein